MGLTGWAAGNAQRFSQDNNCAAQRGSRSLASFVGAASARAERKSPQTVKVYGDGVRRFLAWCPVNGHPAVLDRATVTAFVADLLDRGAEPATARSRQLALSSAWGESATRSRRRVWGRKTQGFRSITAGCTAAVWST